MTKRKVSIASVLKGNFENQERLLAEMTADLEKDRAYLFPKAPQVHTFSVTLHSFWAREGEKSAYVTERKPLKKVLKLAVLKFKELNKRSDVQAFWHVSVILPSGREVHIPETQWAHLRELPLAKNVFHHDDPPCKERLTIKDKRNYCTSCKVHPDTQSRRVWRYCPTCDIPLTDMECTKCHMEYA